MGDQMGLHSPFAPVSNPVERHGLRGPDRRREKRAKKWRSSILPTVEAIQTRGQILAVFSRSAQHTVTPC
jgi:hypothetical protein